MNTPQWEAGRNLCACPCLVWCRAGWRPRSVSECHTSPAALRGPCSAPVAGSASLKPPISLEPPCVKPQSQQSLLLQGRTTAGADFHWMLLTRSEGQSPQSGFGCGPVAVTATASTGRKTHGRNHRTSHTDTLQGQEEREETTASKRKRTPLLIYTPPQHSTGHGLGVQEASCWVLLGPHSPTETWKSATVFPRQKENMEKLRDGEPGETEQFPPPCPASPDLYKRDREVRVKGLRCFSRGFSALLALTGAVPLRDCNYSTNAVNSPRWDQQKPVLETEGDLWMLGSCPGKHE